MKVTHGILSCCGLSSVHALDLRDKEEYHYTLTTAIRQCKKDGSSYILASTADYQLTAVEKLKKAGFKPLRKFKNRNTDCTITIWGLTI
jgi:hypothetical protein